MGFGPRRREGARARAAPGGGRSHGGFGAAGRQQRGVCAWRRRLVPSLGERPPGGGVHPGGSPFAAKGVVRAQHRYRRAQADFDLHAELEGYGTYRTQVGIIGASTIGRRVIELLAPFDLTVALFDPTLGSDEARALGVTPMSLDELMRTSRVVSLHAPWLPSTEGMIGASELAALPDGATFVNTARGALVDEAALVRELASGRIDAYLDVTWPEPPALDSPLWSLPNVVLTPHLAGSAGNELIRMGASAVREVSRAVRGEPLHHAVDADAFDRLA